LCGVAPQNISFGWGRISSIEVGNAYTLCSSSAMRASGISLSKKLGLNQDLRIDARLNKVRLLIK